MRKWLHEISYTIEQDTTRIHLTWQEHSVYISMQVTYTKTAFMVRSKPSLYKKKYEFIYKHQA